MTERSRFKLGRWRNHGFSQKPFLIDTYDRLVIVLDEFDFGVS